MGHLEDRSRTAGARPSIKPGRTAVSMVYSIPGFIQDDTQSCIILVGTSVVGTRKPEDSLGRSGRLVSWNREAARHVVVIPPRSQSLLLHTPLLRVIPIHITSEIKLIIELPFPPPRSHPILQQVAESEDLCPECRCFAASIKRALLRILGLERQLEVLAGEIQSRPRAFVEALEEEDDDIAGHVGECQFGICGFISPSFEVLAKYIDGQGVLTWSSRWLLRLLVLSLFGVVWSSKVRTKLRF